MIDNYRIVAAVTAGRRRYLEILLPYLWAQRGLVDRCDLWCNTRDRDDVAYIRQTAAADSFFRVVEPRLPVDGTSSLAHFFRHCVDLDTVYIRLDDDICWIAPDALENLVRFRLKNPAPAIVLANTVNNAACSQLHQRLGCLPLEEGLCRDAADDELGCRSGRFAQMAHEALLRVLEVGETGNYLFPQWIHYDYERVPINCFCWLGRDFARFKGEVNVDMESWLTTTYPAESEAPNVLCGSALVSHFASGPQRPWLEANTDLQERYQTMARLLPPLPNAPVGTEETVLRKGQPMTAPTKAARRTGRKG